jgi:hypothetical protein
MKGRPSRKYNKKKRTRKMRGGGASTYIFYHIFCNANTLNTVRDQVTKIIFSGLYSDVTKVYCFLAGEKEHIDRVKGYLQTLPKKFEIKAEGAGDNSYERFTLDKIDGLITDADKFLYIHTKGVSRHQDPNNHSDCILLWRNYMEYYLIGLYKKCLEKLDNHDIVGVAYKDVQIGPHFSGNFWWSTGKYFKQLFKDKKIGPNYNDTESYIFLNNPKFCRLDGNVISNTQCLYSTPLHMKYVDSVVN